MKSIEPIYFAPKMIEKVREELKNYDLFQMAKTYSGKRDESEIEEDIIKMYARVYSEKNKNSLDLPSLLIRELSVKGLVKMADGYVNKQEAEREGFYLAEKYRVWYKIIWT